MRRGRRIALVGLLLLLAAAQVAVSLRQAVQLAPPPQLFSPPQDATSAVSAATPMAGAEPSTRATAAAPAGPASAQPVATPDPANILRVTIREGGLVPLRMQAVAGKRLQLMVMNDDRTVRVLEVVGPAGASVRSDDITKGRQENVFIETASGLYRVRVVGTDLEAELRVP